MSQFVETIQSYLPKSEPLRSIGTTVALGVAATITAKVALTVTGVISDARRESAAKARRAAQKKDTVYLFGFPKTPDGGQLSAFVERVEAFLRINKIPYEFVPSMDNSLSDTGRLPVIELNGAQITDSKFIVDHLETTFAEKMIVKQSDLDREQQTRNTSLLALTEYIRWHHYRATMIDNPEYVIEMYGAMLTYPKFIVRHYILSMKKTMIKTWNDAGHGDLTDAQYNQQFLEDVKALDYYCDQANKDNKFILGTDKPSKGDALVAPWIRNVRRPEKLSGKIPAFAFACSSDNMKKYLERFDAFVEKQ